ncbi:MAG TPA: DUF5985 family protein [Bryobacteraceae bacterium]|jgi:uncharacterized membrane protein HdeD (DUF308 family)|nr:DUF5985 family protein [Bryobacteraceae bacterium]
MMLVEGFLIGLIATASVTAGVFFLKFWRKTGDSFFLSFAASFIIEGLNRSAGLFSDRPNEGSPWRYLIRLLSFLLILVAIIRKNSSDE